MNAEEAPEVKKMKLQLDEPIEQPTGLQFKDIPAGECLEITELEVCNPKIEDGVATADGGLLEHGDDKDVNAKNDTALTSDESTRNVDREQETKSPPKSEIADLTKSSSVDCVSQDIPSVSEERKATLVDEAVVPEYEADESENELAASEDEHESEDENNDSENDHVPVGEIVAAFSDEDLDASDEEAARSEDDESIETDEAFGDESYTEDSSDGETLSLVLALQKRRLALERAKLEFEEKLFNREMEMRNKKLEFEMERIRMENKLLEKQKELKMQQMEMREKISKFELDAIADKINNN